MTDPIFLDLEVYPNYFLAKFINMEGKVREYEMYDGGPLLDIEGIRRIMNSYTTVTFNGVNYDFPILSLALAGKECAELKEASDAIVVHDMKPWNFYRHFKCNELSYDHIDIKEVAPGVMVSLKAYGARMHMPKLQDLPYDPDKPLTRQQMQEVADYCLNDLETTRELFKQIKGRIELRESMSAEYRTDLRSKSDAQVAEAVIKTELFRLSGKKQSKPSVKEKQFFYKVPDYIDYRTPQLQEVLEMVRRSPFTAKTNGQIEMTQELADTLIDINMSVYKLGIGGLHSQENERSFTNENDYELRDIDVTSYYPSIILNQELYPENLGPYFLEVFKVLVDRRVGAKATVKALRAVGVDVSEEQVEQLERGIITMDALRITINGAFGKLGSVYSALYAPDLMIQVTVTGQLTLLMLIEQLELNDIPVVSANTDGIVMHYPKCQREKVDTIVRDFERRSKFQFEDTYYSGLYSRDVNNYIAIKTDGKVKTKGAFSPGGLQKNPQNDICNEALIAYLKDGTSPEQTIRECKDLTKFLTTRTVRGGGVQAGNYLGKVVRWYYGTNSPGTINYMKSGNKVPRSDGAIACMNLPLDFPNNIDYNFYVNEVNDLLMDVGLKERPPVVKKTRSKKK
jgi:DNA polymerase elongation subunit (family B)